MSFTNSTTHYGFPLPLGTDLTVPMDYNQAMNDIDEHLFDAESDASTAATASANAVETANNAAAEVGTLGETVNDHSGRLTSLEQHDIIQDNKIDALEISTGIKFDSVGIADAYINGITYAVGDVVTYNGQRYKCITAVTAAEPFDSDKWQGEDVQTALDEINSDLSAIHAETINDTTGATIVTNTSSNIEVDVAKSGYTAIGIVGFQYDGTGVSNVLCSRFYLARSAQKAHIVARNVSSSDVTIDTLQVDVLYVKAN